MKQEIREKSCEGKERKIRNTWQKRGKEGRNVKLWLVSIQSLYICRVRSLKLLYKFKWRNKWISCLKSKFELGFYDVKLGKYWIVVVGCVVDDVVVWKDFRLLCILEIVQAKYIQHMKSVCFTWWSQSGVGSWSQLVHGFVTTYTDSFVPFVSHAKQMVIFFLKLHLFFICCFL